VSAVVGRTLVSNFDSFADHGGKFVHPEEGPVGESSMVIDPFQHLAVALGPVTLAPGETTSIDIVLAWSFPQHRWHACETAQGNFGQVDGGAVATAETTLATAPQREAQALAWHELCTAADLPDWLQDALINTPAALYKTSMWTREGQWRMWESHSCADLQPGHLHFYHAQLLNTLFPSFDRQLVEFYADSQFPSGQVSNSFGRPNIACNFDVPDQDPGINPSSWQGTGLARLDTVAVFILDNLLNFQTHADGKSFLQGKQYHAVTKAVGNMITSSAEIGLPRRRYNTFDGGLQGETNTCTANN
jgi:hypothetical protein